MTKQTRALELVNLANACMAEGRLPKTLPSRAVGHSSEGAICNLCQLRIEVGELQISLLDERYELSFHPACRSAWRLAVELGTP